METNNKQVNSSTEGHDLIVQDSKVQFNKE